MLTELISIEEFSRDFATVEKRIEKADKYYVIHDVIFFSLLIGVMIAIDRLVDFSKILYLIFDFFGGKLL